MLGYVDQAVDSMLDHTTLAQESGQPFLQAWAEFVASILRHYRREVREAWIHAEAGTTLATEHVLQPFTWWCKVMRGWAIAEQGNVRNETTEILHNLNSLGAVGTQLIVPYFHALLAEMYEKTGQLEEALQVVTDALSIVNKTGEHQYEAELYRLERRADASVQSPKSKVQSRRRSRGIFSEIAIEIARKQQAKSLELRAVMSLAACGNSNRCSTKHTPSSTKLTRCYPRFTTGSPKV
jgi:predicted ATPase